MLYYSFTNQNNLLLVNNQLYSLYINTFQTYNYSYSYLDDFYTNSKANSSDSDNNSANNSKNKQENKQENNYLLANFKTFAYYQPRNNFTKIDSFNRLSS